MTTAAPVFEVGKSASSGPTERNGVPARFVELKVNLEAATTRVAIHAPGDGLGRAEALFGKNSWAAKHYWSEGDEDQQVTVFEFDEALPAGPLTLRIPVLATE
ncbi:MAG TPA: hypothetical protein VGG33_11340 [Polyangia bacterium]